MFVKNFSMARWQFFKILPNSRMQRFLDLTLDPKSNVPPIGVIIDKIDEDKNNVFYVMGNWLHSTDELNPIYTLVAIKDIIKLSPLSEDKMKSPDDLNPLNSYKWLYLLHSISSRKVDSDDQELEDAKNQYVLNSYIKFLKNVDFSVKFAPEFTVAVITVFARFIQEYKCDISSVINDDLYQILINFLNNEIQGTNESIPLSAFINQTLFAFLSPLGIEFYQKSNLFQNINQLIKAAIVRLLLRIVPIVFPGQCLEAMKIALHPLCVTGPVVNVAMKILTLLFKNDENAAFKFKDSIQYKLLCAQITKHAHQTNNFKNALTYQASIELSTALAEIQKLASRNPSVWANYILENPEIEQYLEALVSSKYDAIFIHNSVTLMATGSVSISNIAYIVQLFITSTSQSLREQLKKLLLSNPENTAAELCKNLKQICNYGSNSQPVFELLRELLTKVQNPKIIITSVLAALQMEYTALRFHPNSHLYNQLQHYIDVTASYLDERPCHVCNNPERIPTQMSLFDNANGVKYNHNEMFFKFKKPLLISNLKLTFNVKMKQKIPKLIKFFVTSVEIKNVNDLRTNQIPWRPISQMELQKGSNSGISQLPIPLFATCLRILFDEFWEDTEGQVLRCPRCNAEVNPISGICPNGHEKVFQCRNCRNIDYNISNPFLCTECGNSNFVDMNWSITAVPSFSHTRVNSHDDVKASLAVVDKLMADAKNIFEQLQGYREQIDGILSPTNTTTITDKIKLLNQLYNNDCKNNFTKLTTIVQHVTEIRRSVARFLGYSSDSEEKTAENMCYNCRQTFIKNSLLFLGNIAQVPDADTAEPAKVLISFIEVPTFTRPATESLLSFCSALPSLTDRVVNIFIQSLPKPSPLLVRLLAEVLKINDSYKRRRFTYIANALIESVKRRSEDSSIMPTVIAPLVQALFNSPLIMLTRENFLLQSIFESWSNKKEGNKGLFDPFEILPEEILKELLLCPNNEVRKQVENLLIKASSLSRKHFMKVYDFVFNVFDQVHTNADEGSNMSLQQTMNVILFLMKNPHVQIKALNTRFDDFVKFLDSEVNALISKEKNLSIDLLAGFNVNLLTSILDFLISDPVFMRFIIIKKSASLGTIIRDYFILKSIVIQRSNYWDISCKALRKRMIELSQPYIEIYKPKQKDDNSPVRRSTSAEIPQLEEDEAIRWESNKGQILLLTNAVAVLPSSPAHVINALYDLVFPPKEALNFQIVLRKIHTQEDLIPGRISSNSINSNDIGLLMRDVKNRICTDLDMQHLMEDDHSMELLVNGNIISLDLPLEDVYLNVWKPTNANKPMVIIFRLQGLDGEATEPMISSFPQTEGDNIAPEIKFKYSTALSKDDGFLPFFTSIQKLDNETVSNLMKLLAQYAIFKENKTAMNRVNGTRFLFELIQTIIKDPETTASDLSPIIELTGILVKDSPNSVESPEKQVLLIFDTLKYKIVIDNEQIMAQLLALLPPLATRSSDLMEQVLEFFITSLKPADAGDDFNFFRTPSSVYYLNGFAEFVLALPNNDACNKLRDIIAQHEFINDAVVVLTSKFPPELDIRSKEWERGTNAVVIPALLKFLAGMVLCNLKTQQVFTEGDSLIIKLLLKLRNIASSNNIGELADNVLAAASSEGSACAKQIADIKHEQEEAEKAKYVKEREALLQQQQESSNALNDLLAQLSDQDECTCCICKEGYLDNPDQQLGIYAYLSRSDSAFPHIATHFVWVHNNCHNADLDPRGGKDQWASAIVKNNETPCNTIFPVPGPCTTTKNYRNALVNCYNRMKRGDVLTTIINDIAYHMEIVSKQQCIPRNFGGGSAEYDVKIIPFLVYAAEALMNEGTSQNTSESRQIMEAQMQKQLSSPSSSVFGYALAILSLEEWNESKLKILEQLVKPIVSKLPNEERFAAVKNILYEFLICNTANEAMKDPSGKAVTIIDGIVQITPHNEENWINTILEKVSNNTQEVLEEWQDIADQIENEFLSINDINTIFQYAHISIDGKTWLNSFQSE